VQPVTWWNEQQIVNQIEKLNTCSSIRPVIVVAEAVKEMGYQPAGRPSNVFAADHPFATRQALNGLDRSQTPKPTLGNMLAEGTGLAQYSGKHITNRLVSRPGGSRGGLAG
jgi:hypothetical protein